MIHTFVLSCLTVVSAWAQPPIRFEARTEPQVRILLGHYGPSSEHPNRKDLKSSLESAFLKATLGKLSIKVLDDIRIADVPEESAPRYVRDGLASRSDFDEARLRRLAYYYRPGFNLAGFLYRLSRGVGVSETQTPSDLLVFTTDAQFENIAYQSNRMILAEFPTEIAWGLPDGGRTEYSSSEQLVDRLIHEIGHGLGLLHSAEHCFQGDPQDPEFLAKIQACCDASPSKNDVMSYCRDRQNPRPQFTDCSLNWLETQAIPRLLRGGAHRYQDQECR